MEYHKSEKDLRIEGLENKVNELEKFIKTINPTYKIPDPAKCKCCSCSKGKK